MCQISNDIEFVFITTTIQFNVKLVGDKHCRCEEGLLQLTS